MVMSSHGSHFIKWHDVWLWIGFPSTIAALIFYEVNRLGIFAVCSKVSHNDKNFWVASYRELQILSPTELFSKESHRSARFSCTIKNENNNIREGNIPYDSYELYLHCLISCLMQHINTKHNWISIEFYRNEESLSWEVYHLDFFKLARKLCTSICSWIIVFEKFYFVGTFLAFNF